MGLDRVLHARRPQACDACAGVNEDGHLSPLAPDRAIERGEAVWIYARGASRSAQLKWKEIPRTCPKQVRSRWAVASAGCKAEVKELALKGTREAETSRQDAGLG
jgi:hypothetical protein